jgi:uncharacterized membrane protein SirB2
MDYLTVKLIHQSAVVLSITGFAVRGAASLADARWVRSRVAKSLPHVVDSVLLLSALVLAWMLRLTPGNAPWLVAKIVGLIAYVGLGVVALRPGRQKVVRAVAWAAALGTVGWIVSVAVTKDPLGFLAVLRRFGPA